MPRFASPSNFAHELRREGLDYLRAAPSGRYADRGQWLRGGLWTLGLVASAIGVLTSGGGWAAIGFAALAGLFGFMFLASFCHDAAHGALSRKPWANRLIVAFGFGLFGVSGALWRWRHVRLHHMFPNVAGTDIDGEGSSMIRLAPHDPWLPHHRLQPYYAPFLYMLVFSHLAWVEDWAHRARARAASPAEFTRTSADIELVAVKLIHALATLALPWLILQPPLWGLLLGYLAYSGVSSILFVVVAAGTHLSEEAEFVGPEAADEIAHGWAEHQLLTSVDWAPENALAVALTGGANAHTAHHLFPDAAHCHNAALSRIVSETAARHGLTHNLTSFAGMLGSHFAYLVRLSRRPEAEEGQVEAPRRAA